MKFCVPRQAVFHAVVSTLTAAVAILLLESSVVAAPEEGSAVPFWAIEPYTVNTPNGPVTKFRRVSIESKKKNSEEPPQLKSAKPAPTDREAILRVWRSRTESNGTVFYSWKERFEKPTDSLGRSWRLGIGMDAFKRKPERSRMQGEHVYRFQISKSSVWSERSGHDLHSMTGKLTFETQRDYYSSKGHVVTTICPEATEDMPELIPVRIAVFKDTTYYAATDYHTSPVILHHCPLDAKHSPITSESIKLTGEKQVIDGYNCARLTDGRLDYWVDSEGLIRRHALVPHFRVDMSYKKDGDTWVLAGWDFEAGGATATSTVTTSEVNGKSIPDGKLLRVPVGAIVQREGKPQYIKLRDGNRREVGVQDYKYGSPTYEELLKSLPGEAVPKAFVELHESMSDVAAISEEERKGRIEELTEYLHAQPRTLTRHIRLVGTVRKRLRDAGLLEAASELSEACRQISEPFRRGMELASEADRLSNTASAQ